MLRNDLIGQMVIGQSISVIKIWESKMIWQLKLKSRVKERVDFAWLTATREQRQKTGLSVIYQKLKKKPLN